MVTVGSLPNALTCNGAQTQALNVCGTVAATIASATTAADGSFTIPAVPVGNYMVVVGKDGSYSALHRKFTVVSGVNALGTVTLTALSAFQQGWLADLNNKQRATVSFPTSFANLTVDEYAQEQAERWTADIISGAATYGDAGYDPYTAAYGNAPGAMYGAGGVMAETYTSGVYGDPSGGDTDDAWMSEKPNCSNGNWQTCPFTGTTGHYINISNTQNVWVGLSESAMSNPIDGYSADVMIVGNAASAGPASLRRVTH
jgi:hypothetical protein